MPDIKELTSYGEVEISISKRNSNCFALDCQSERRILTLILFTRKELEDHLKKVQEALNEQ